MVSGGGESPGPITPKMGGGQDPHHSQFHSQFLAEIAVFTPETAHSEARFGLLVKKDPGGQILSQIGALWTHFVTIFRSWVPHRAQRQWAP